MESIDCIYRIFQSKLHEVSRIAYMQPISSAGALLMWQVTAENYDENAIKLLNTNLKRAYKYEMKNVQ